MPARSGDGSVEMLAELQTVRETSQRIVEGEIADLILGQQTLANAPGGDGGGDRESHDDEDAGGERDGRKQYSRDQRRSRLIYVDEIDVFHRIAVEHRHYGQTATLDVGRDGHRSILESGVDRGR